MIYNYIIYAVCFTGICAAFALHYRQKKHEQKKIQFLWRDNAVQVVVPRSWDTKR